MTDETSWSLDSWRSKPDVQQITYDDPERLQTVLEKLRSLPPLVTSWEIERLRGYLADAQRGARFLLQGGDCAETLADCRSDIIANKLKILLQMSLVLVLGSKKPVIRVGRFAGQYAKPRSKPVETRTMDDGTVVELPSYFGDLVNQADFSTEARRLEPELLIQGYQHAAATLNFIRSLSAGGFADLHHPEYWDLSFFEMADLPDHIKKEYQQLTDELANSLHFMEALGEDSVAALTRVEFFTSHEGLNLSYESSQTRRVPRREGVYDLTVHLPWIGDRTRALDGAHVEFFRGIRNPLGIKCGPSLPPEDIEPLLERLNPDDDPGRIVLIVRLGSENVEPYLPRFIDTVKATGRTVLWISDPMHGNTVKTNSGRKTRDFSRIVSELRQSFDIHEAHRSHLGGVHFEMTGEDVTECMGGGVHITEQDLERNYATLCDPRLNYAQAMEMAFLIARRMEGG